jgi:tetratricopeptide (TPR) repeat protein
MVSNGNRQGRWKWSVALLVVLVITLLAVSPWWWHQLTLNAIRRDISNRQLDTALTQLLAVRDVWTSCPETHFLLARTYRRLGDAQQSRRFLERAERLGHPVAQIRREQRLTLAQAGRLSEVEPYLGEMLEDPSGDAREVCEAFVNGYLRNYRMGDAMRMIEAWKGDFPEDAQAWVAEAMITTHLLQWKETVQAYQKAHQLDSQREDIWLGLAEALVEQHDYEEANELFLRVLDRDENHRQALIGLARCRQAEGRTDEALEFLDRLLQLDPDDFDGLLEMGRLQLAEGDADAAWPWLEKAYAQNSRHRGLRYELGAAARILGKSEEAQEHLDYVQRANDALAKTRLLMQQVQENPRLIDPRIEIGKNLIEYGSPREGIAWIEGALQLDPSHAAARQALAEHYGN